VNSLIRIGTRQTNLALKQALLLKQQLATLGMRSEIFSFSTKGDEISDPLRFHGGKGLFVKQIEEVLLSKEIDVAVHATKDLPFEETPGLVLASYLKREMPFDVWVGPAPYVEKNGKRQPTSTSSILQKETFCVGTCSLRRKWQLLHLMPEVLVKDIRGSVETRLEKMKKGHYEALMLAGAGLRRLNLAHHIAKVFSPEEVVPAVGQGALVLQCRAGDEKMQNLLKRLNHQETQKAVTCERGFLKKIQGQCDTPVGGYVFFEKDDAFFYGFLSNPDGSASVRLKRHIPLDVFEKKDQEAWGQELGDVILELKGKSVL